MRHRNAFAVAVLTAASVLTVACSDSSPDPVGPTASAPTNGGTRPETTMYGPKPPERGVVLGAWVQPQVYTDPGRIQAVEDYESAVGRPLGVVQDFHPWDEQFPSSFDRDVVDSDATLLLSWAGTDTVAIAAGRHDDLIEQRARAVKQLGKPILLRWRWEMDRPNLAGEVIGPDEYVAAWKHIREIFAREGTTNVGWVWCPLANGFDSGVAGDYYPGDDQVDWICADVYADDPAVPFTQVAGAFLAWAQEHPRPIIFAEVGTQRAGTGERVRWLQDAAAAMRANAQVKSFVYFESNVNRNGRVRNWSLRGWPDDLDVMRELSEDKHFQAELSD